MLCSADKPEAEDDADKQEPNWAGAAETDWAEAAAAAAQLPTSSGAVQGGEQGWNWPWGSAQHGGFLDPDALLDDESEGKSVYGAQLNEVSCSLPPLLTQHLSTALWLLFSSVCVCQRLAKYKDAVYIACLKLLACMLNTAELLKSLWQLHKQHAFVKVQSKPTTAPAQQERLQPTRVNLQVQASTYGWAT